MMKSILCFGVSVLLVLAVTSGCGGESEKKRSAPSSPAKVQSSQKKTDPAKAPAKTKIQPSNQKVPEGKVPSETKVQPPGENEPAEKDTEKDVLPEKVSGRDDPFDPGIAKQESQSGSSRLRLQGIVLDGEASHVIVNNEIYETGAKFGRYTVKEIKQNSIVVNDGTEDFEVRLSGEK